ncbi:MAG: RNA polymerase sigma-54 factor, partial [Bacteroidales bacterium]
MLNQRLQQKLLQKLSPQQILLMKLLQIPSVGLEQRIKQEIEDNPALEVDGEEMSDYDADDQVDSETEGDDYTETSLDDYKEKDSEFDLNDYINDDDVPSYKLQTNNYSADDERKEIPFASGITFHELLEEQLRQQYLDERKLQIGLYIIGNLDDSGYLQRSLEAIVDDLAFGQNMIIEKSEVEHVLSIIQEFDPSGVGARNLKECLLIQLQR